MKRIAKIIMVLCLPIALMLATVISAPAVKAADSIYQVTGDATETGAFITGVINGTEKDGSGNAYTGISFPAKTLSYSLTADMLPNRNFTFTTAKGAVITVDKGFSFPSTSLAQDITFKGEGSFKINGSAFGIYGTPKESVNLLFESGSFYITNTKECGIYMFGYDNSWDTSSLQVTGGYFEISNCSNADNWGGIDAEGGLFKVSNGAEMVIKNNGGMGDNFMFGDIYFQNMSPVIEGQGTSLTVTSTSKASNAVTIPASTLTIKNNATVTINHNGTGNEARGFNGSSTAESKIVISSGGTLKVVGNKATTSSGIRKIDVTVDENSILDVSGFEDALDGSFLTANKKSFVTLDGTKNDNASDTATVIVDGITIAAPNSSTITGGSVKEDPATSIVKGLLNTIGTSQVATTPVNKAGETLTRFDLTGKAGSEISIAADPADATNHPAYTYTVGSDHSGTSYVWAPAVTVTFWPSKADYTANTTTKIIQTNYTIRGNNILMVGGSLPADPTAPANQVFLKWIDAATGKEFIPGTTTVTANMNVYATYAIKPLTVAAEIPIDLLVDNGDGTTYINGPREAQIGGTVKYSSTIDMSQIAAIAARFTGKGYVTGTFTITLKGSDGVKPASGFGTSADINDYFAGGAIELFELTAAPTYDSGTNLITFTVKVKDEYNQLDTALTGTECAAILNKGISGSSNYTAIVNKKIATDGYARAIATFTGTLNYCSVDGTKNFIIDMTGVQADPDNLKDPTLATLGSDPDTAVSATVTYKASHPNTGDDSLIWFNGQMLVLSAAALSAIVIFMKKRKAIRQ